MRRLERWIFGGVLLFTLVFLVRGIPAWSPTGAPGEELFCALRRWASPLALPLGLALLRARAPVLRWLGLVGIVGLASPLLAPTPNRMDFSGQAPMSWAHPLGTDLVGRDVLARILDGSAFTLCLAGLAVVVSTSVGTTVGALAGYLGGRWDRLLMWGTDLFLALPRLLLAFVVLYAAGGDNSSRLVQLVVVLGLTSWMEVARLVRAVVQSLRDQDFLLSCRALGLPLWRVVRYHLLPHVAPVVLVNAAFAAGSLILTESALSFLGLGLAPPAATWGSLTREWASDLGSWRCLAPAGAIAGLVVGLNLLGEELRRRV